LIKVKNVGLKIYLIFEIEGVFSNFREFQGLLCIFPNKKHKRVRADLFPFSLHFLSLPLLVTSRAHVSHGPVPPPPDPVSPAAADVRRSSGIPPVAVRTRR
jgi:hypothetical protein